MSLPMDLRSLVKSVNTNRVIHSINTQTSADDTNIVDLKSYHDRLKKSIKSKTSYFLNHIPDDGNTCWLDIGCADGAVLHYIATRRPRDIYLGFDNNTNALNLGAREYQELILDHNLLELQERAIYHQTDGMRVVILLNSVLHEVYSKHDHNRVTHFWDELFGFMPDYICIRDMGMPFDTLFLHAKEDWVRNIHKLGDPEQISSFRKSNTAFKYHADVIEFLLKYRYTENWERELKERYLLDTDRVDQEINRSKYDIIHSREFNVPWIVEKIKDDFEIDLGEINYAFTHFTRIVKKKENKLFGKICQYGSAVPVW